MNKDLLELTENPASWRLKLTVQKLLTALRKTGLVPRGASLVLSISCVDARRMKALNAKYRGKNRPTDVLSFENPNRGNRNLVLLGDLVLCRDVVRAQARELGHGVREEATILTAHGLLHLLGYDHERSSREARRQLLAETKLLRAAGFGRLVKTALLHRNGLGKK